MAKTTIVFALLLVAVGVVGYLGTDAAPAADSGAAAEVAVDAPADADSAKPKRSVTALIPAFFGVLLLLCGLLAFKESMLMHAMHGAVLVGLIGALAGAGRGFSGLGKFMSGDPSLNQRSFLFVWLMTIICLVYVILCVRSFIQARKRRKLEEAAVEGA